MQKNRDEKLRELEKIDKALDKQKNDIKKSTQKLEAVVKQQGTIKNTMPCIANKLSDLQWVMDRFTY